MSRIWIEATSVSMELKGSGSWADTTWTIRHDGTIIILTRYFLKRNFLHGFKITGFQDELTESEMNKLKKSISDVIDWVEKTDFDSEKFWYADDGAALKIKVYDQTNGKKLLDFYSDSLYESPQLGHFEKLLEKFDNGLSENL